MISQTAEYALRAMIWLAGRPNEQFSAGVVAKTTRVPPGYLAKVLQNLARAGLLDSRRGIGGGFTLARSPDDISIWQVVDAVDPIRRISSCPLGLASHGEHLCPLHHRIDAAIAATEDAFRSTSLAELLAEPTKSPPLCDCPRSRKPPADSPKSRKSSKSKKAARKKPAARGRKAKRRT